MTVKQYLDSRRVAYKIYPHPRTEDAQHLARALHVPGANVAKTVLLRANGDFRCLVAILPATEQIDFDRVSAALGGATIHLAKETELANRCPELERGILPPFGSQYGLQTLVDESLARHEDIFFQGDTHEEAIRMKYSDFCALESPLLVSIRRDAASPATD